MDAPPLFAAPAKHSVTIAGHRTSISLEPVFWDALLRIAQERALPVNTLIASIDSERIAVLRQGGGDTPPNLASAIRCWLWKNCCE
jgi:predicted DNA-binding ribbon-helix-helix protein